MRFLTGPNETARAHPGLILLLGGCAGWLWSFPLYGPVLAAAGARRGLADVGAVSEAFLVLHVIGLVAAGCRPAVVKVDRLLFYASALTCGLLTAAFAPAAPGLWPYLGGTLGVAAAPFLVAWGRRLATDVEPAHRGQVMALSLFVGVLLNAVQMFVAGKAPEAGLPVSALLFLVPVFAARRFLPTLPAGPEECRRLPRSGTPRSILRPLGTWWQFAVLVFLFYLVGGLMYQVMQPVIGQHVPATPYLATFAYGAASLAAGPLADRRGRRFLPPAGVGLVGSSFALSAFWPGPPGYALAQILIQAGYACLDLFIFLYLADRAAGKAAQAARYYGWGLGLNVFAVLAGTLAGGFLQAAWLAEHPLKAALLVCLVLFTAFPFLVGLRESLPGDGDKPRSGLGDIFVREPGRELEPAPELNPGVGRVSAAVPVLRAETEQGEKVACRPGSAATPGMASASFAAAACTGPAPTGAAVPPAEAVDRLRHCLLGKGFTLREIEIALLILEGLDNTAIALRLCITKNTLKTHMRHILKKAKATGRVSFILWAQETTKKHLFE